MRLGPRRPLERSDSSRGKEGRASVSALCLQAPGIGKDRKPNAVISKLSNRTEFFLALDIEL